MWELVKQKDGSGIMVVDGRKVGWFSKEKMEEYEKARDFYRKLELEWLLGLKTGEDE